MGDAVVEDGGDVVGVTVWAEQRVLTRVPWRSGWPPPVTSRTSEHVSSLTQANGTTIRIAGALDPPSSAGTGVHRIARKDAQNRVISKFSVVPGPESPTAGARALFTGLPASVAEEVPGVFQCLRGGIGKAWCLLIAVAHGAG